MTVEVDERGRNNIYAKEPKMYYQEETEMKFGFTEYAEKLNGRMAMIGVVAALLNYASTGQILPGVF